VLVQLPHETDEELRTIHSLWEYGLLRGPTGYFWGTIKECASWAGTGDPTGEVFKEHAHCAYIELEE